MPAKTAYPWIHPALAPLAVPVKKLKQDPENARRHPVRNLDVIEHSLAAHGQTLPLIIRPDGTVLVGNGRLAVVTGRDLPLEPGGSKAGRWSHVAALPFKGTAEQARALALRDNRAGELAEWDTERLSKMFQEMGPGPHFDALGWLDWEANPLLQAEWRPAPIDDSPEAVGKRVHRLILEDAEWAAFHSYKDGLGPGVTDSQAIRRLLNMA